MRSMNQLGACLLLIGALAPGCAGTRALHGVGVRELEMAHDDGRPAQRPILPDTNFELLIKNEPNLPAYRPAVLRFQLAQPGRILFQLYRQGPDGRPGAVLCRIDRYYDAPLVSDGADGKWVVEGLPELPRMSGPIWIGVSRAEHSSEARVWAAQNDSGHVFQRDVEPETALMSSPVHYTPMVRLVLDPEPG